MRTVAKGRILVTRFPLRSTLGGTCVHTMELMHALDKRGYEVFFLGSCSILHRLFEEKGFEARRAWLGKPPVKPLWRVLFVLLAPLLFGLAGWYLWRAKQTWKVDTVYMVSLGAKLLMTPWAKLLGLRCIWMEHHWPKTEMRRGIFYKWFKWSAKWAEVLVPSKKMQEAYAEMGVTTRVLTWGIRRHASDPLPERIREFISSGFCVGAVSRLSVDKGVDKMVKLVHSKPDMKLVLVGDGELRELVQEAEKSGQVLWVPSLARKELMSLYEQLDAFIFLPQKEEAFGFVAAEAMASRTPVIVARNSGLAHELVDGKEALIVGTRYTELDKALKKLMRRKELAQQIRVRGSRFVREHHKLGDMVQNFEALLQDRV